MKSLSPLLFLLAFCLGIAYWWRSPADELHAAPSSEQSYAAELGIFERGIVPAAHRLEQYEHFLQGKRLALLVNHTATIGNTHLVDTLLARGHKIVKIFAPEHGFRGDADNGEKVKNMRDPRTNIPIISLYGENLRPQAAEFADIDIVIFDVQDVGVRFYTYTTSMTYMMEACARFGKAFLVLDRPNPNGHYVDGPVLVRKNASFVGLHPVPIVHGLTVAEYARMINEEGWLREGLKCDLHYVPCDNYRHDMLYEVPLAPSPNLRTMRSIYLYPSLCLLEGTTASLGRGTDAPFERYGHPKYPKGKAKFTPQPAYGSKNPPHKGVECRGYDLSRADMDTLQAAGRMDIEFLVDFYRDFPRSETFFNDFFERLAGDGRLRAQIEAGASAADIRLSWEADLKAYRKLREKYLLYPEK